VHSGNVVAYYAKIPLKQSTRSTKKPSTGESSPEVACVSLVVDGRWRYSVRHALSPCGIDLNSEKVSLNNRTGINKQKNVNSKKLLKK